MKEILQAQKRVNNEVLKLQELMLSTCTRQELQQQMARVISVERLVEFKEVIGEMIKKNRMELGEISY